MGLYPPWEDRQIMLQCLVREYMLDSHSVNYLQYSPPPRISYILSDNISSIRNNYESAKCTLDSESPKCTLDTESPKCASYISGHLGRSTVHAVHHCGCTITMNHHNAKSVIQNRYNTNNKEGGLNSSSPYLHNYGSPGDGSSSVGFLTIWARR